MIVPLKWIKDYLTTHKSPKEIAKSFTEIGLMLDRPINGDVLDLEHRMDRADWLSILGCARDLAAFENIKFEEPELKSTNLEKNNLLEIKIDSDKVNKFRTRIIKNVEVKESPKFIQERLIEYGLPVINNIVDITNFVMIEYGQPLHAQDIDKFETKEIVLRDAIAGESIQTLDETTTKLIEGTLVLSESKKPICIGGIVGGFRTGVTKETKNIVLDAGNYDQASIRKASRSLNIRNETVSRSEKFLSPELVDLAIIRATDLILENAGGEAYENDDYENYKPTSRKMVLTKNRLEKISGEKFYFEKAEDILDRLNYEIISKNDEEIIVKTPFFRTDIEVEDDLIADVLRIYGYSKIESEPINNFPPADITPKILKLQENITNILVSEGLHEHITDPFLRFDGNSNRVLLFNSVNSDKDSLRLSIKESLKNALEFNKKIGNQSIQLFEIGNVYFKSNEELLEERRLGILIDFENVDKNSLEIRKIINSLLLNLNVSYELKGSKMGISIYHDQKEIGFFEENYAEFYLDKILHLNSFKTYVVSDIENLSKEDLTFTSHIDASNGEVIDYMKSLNPLISKIDFIGEFQTESQRKVTIRFFTAYPNEMKKIREEIINNTSKKFGVTFY
jgi:phenylalanyl-tRNA synthetase beta subunit